MGNTSGKGNGGGERVGDVGRDIVAGDLVRGTSEQGCGSGRRDGGHVRAGPRPWGTCQSRDMVVADTVGDPLERGCSGGVCGGGGGQGKGRRNGRRVGDRVSGWVIGWVTGC